MSMYPFMGRKCYDHIGGKLGRTLLEFFLSEGWVKLKGDTSTIYEITAKGYVGFSAMGVDLPEALKNNQEDK